VLCWLLASSGAVILLDDMPGQPAMLGHIQAVLLGPRADLAAALPAGRGPGRDGRSPRADRPGSFHEGRQPTAEVGGVLFVQVYLECPSVQAELDGLVSRAAGQIIFKLDFKLLHCSPRNVGRWAHSLRGFDLMPAVPIRPG
jgi:hypothetical protein